MNPEILLQRLTEIARSVEQTGNAKAMIGLGSVGRERHRLDEYSDLDFFVIAEDGRKNDLLLDLTWLQRVAPTAFFFRNTRDGYK